MGVAGALISGARGRARLSAAANPARWTHPGVPAISSLMRRRSFPRGSHPWGVTEKRHVGGLRDQPGQFAGFGPWRPSARRRPVSGQRRPIRLRGADSGGTPTLGGVAFVDPGRSCGVESGPI